MWRWSQTSFGSGFEALDQVSAVPCGHAPSLAPVAADMTAIPPQVSRQEFNGFWNRDNTWRSLIPHGIYLLGFALSAALARLIEPPESFREAFVALAVVYIVLVPWLGVRAYHRRNAKFLRCANCGDWFGRDSSGAWIGPNPKWRDVTRTGRCTKCGAQVLADR